MKSVSLLPCEQDGHVEMSLPWYVNGTLSAAESAAVEMHLSSCAECRASHQLERRLREQLRDGSVATGHALESVPAHAEETAGPPDSVPVSALLVARRDGESPPRRRAWRAAVGVLLIAQAAAIGVLAVALLTLTQRSGIAEYRTLTDAGAVADASAPALHVVFAEATTAGEIRELLEQIGGTISAGPSASDVYTIRLVRSGDRRPQDADAAASWLRAQKGVRFAEAVAADYLR